MKRGILIGVIILMLMGIAVIGGGTDPPKHEQQDELSPADRKWVDDMVHGIREWCTDHRSRKGICE